MDVNGYEGAAAGGLPPVDVGDTWGKGGGFDTGDLGTGDFGKDAKPGPVDPAKDVERADELGAAAANGVYTPFQQAADNKFGPSDAGKSFEPAFDAKKGVDVQLDLVAEPAAEPVAGPQTKGPEQDLGKGADKFLSEPAKLQQQTDEAGADKTDSGKKPLKEDGGVPAQEAMFDGKLPAADADGAKRPDDGDKMDGEGKLEDKLIFDFVGGDLLSLVDQKPSANPYS